MLGVGPPEDAPHVVRLRVAVHGQVAAADGVEVVEADRERGAELLVDLGPEHRCRVQPDEHLEGHLDRPVGAEPTRIPLSGAMSSYPRAGIGGLGLKPSSSCAQWPPHEVVLKVGRVRKGRAASAAAPHAGPARQPPGLPASWVSIQQSIDRRSAPGAGRATASRRRTGAASSVAGPPAGCPRLRPSPEVTAASAYRLGRSAYQSSSCATSAAPGPKTRVSRVSASRGLGHLVEEIGQRAARNGREIGIVRQQLGRRGRLRSSSQGAM